MAAADEESTPRLTWIRRVRIGQGQLCRPQL
jgi:hypothetical protein